MTRAAVVRRRARSHIGMLVLASAALVLTPRSEPEPEREPQRACQRVALEPIGSPADRPRFRAALEQCVAHGLQEPSIRLAYALFESHWGAAEYRDALAFGELALAQAQALGDDAWLRTVLLGLFALRSSIGDLDGAEVAHRRARASVDRSDVDQWAYVRIGDGAIRKQRGELEGAIAAYLDVLDVAPPGHPSRSDARFNLIEVYLELGRIAQARQQFEAVLEGHDAPQEDRWTYRLSVAEHRAKLAEVEGDYVGAEAALRTILSDRDIPLDWTWSLQHTLGRVLAARGDVPGAVAAYEQAIAAVETLRSTFGEEELQAWVLAAKRAPYESLFVLHVEQGEPLPALQVLAQAQERAFLDAFIRGPGALHMTEQGPLDAATRAEALPGLVRELQASPSLGHRSMPEVLAAIEGRHALVYLWADTRLWLITLGSGAPRFTALALAPAELERGLGRLLADPDDVDAAAALGAALVPKEALPERGRPVHVITDGALGELPFATLVVDGRRLVLDHPIAYAPGLSVLAAWSESGPSSREPPVVLGDPQGNLPAAATEVVEVAAWHGAVPLLGADAGRDGLRRAADSSLLHVAAHAGYDARGPWLELADGRVHAHEILEMRLRPSVVVLATCVSASRPGAGPWGSLGAAFLAGGSRAVLATLWSVDDAATRQLALRFHREGGASDPVEALHRTQQALAVAGEPVSVWAPFVVLGASRIGHDSPE